MKIFKIKYLFLVFIVFLFNLNIVFAESINLGNFTDYRNKSLKLKFSYPKSWGKVETQYNTNLKEAIDPYIADFTYSIHFTDNKNMLFSTAEKSMSTIEKIYNSPVSAFCYNIEPEKNDIADCKNIQDNIIIFSTYYNYNNYCLDAPIIGLIGKIVSIDLMDNDFMDVLTFEYSFLSADLQKELTDIVDQGGCYYEGEEGYEETSKLFNDKVDEILARIETGEIDDETKENLENFDYFANSITEWKAFENWPDWAQTEITWALNNNILDSDESVLEKVDENSFKYTLAKMLYSYYINDTGTKYEGEIINGAWPDWSNESVSWAINEKIIDSSETVMEPVSEEAFKYTLSVILKRYDESKNY